ncbi:MAG: septum formation family protein [Salinibacterium sp.]|nr:septum formation family protein [Salinibacterium sp.]
MRHVRPTALLATAIVAALSLSGCNVLAPTRDAAGLIVGEVQMPSTDAWVGDCFNFVENSNFSYATVVPCTEQHSYVVIGKGTLSDRRIARFDNIQVALIQLCQSTFDAYAADKNPAPEPQYIVARNTLPDGSEITNYSCLATDAA